MEPSFWPSQPPLPPLALGVHRPTFEIASFAAWTELRTALDREGRSSRLVRRLQAALFIFEIAGGICEGGFVNYTVYSLYASSLLGDLSIPKVEPDPAPTIEKLEQKPTANATFKPVTTNFDARRPRDPPPTPRGGQFVRAL